MKVTETIERNCCAPQDLKQYRGANPAHHRYQFCQHCGQLWREFPAKFPDPAGGPRGTDIERVLPGERSC